MDVGEGNGTHSSSFAWKILWMEEPSGLQSMGCWGSDTTEHLHFHFSLSCIGEGNGIPLQLFCLENPMDRGAWWAAVHEVAKRRKWQPTPVFLPGESQGRRSLWAAIYGVAQSQTPLKQLSSSSSPICMFLEVLWYPLLQWNAQDIVGVEGFIQQIR